jgi:hypothetical protein
MEPLLTPEDVARLLAVPTATLAQWRYRHQGPPFLRVGRCVRYDRADVLAYLQGRKIGVRGPSLERKGNDVCVS